MNIKKRFYILLIAILLVVVIGSTGYFILLGGEPPFIDCIYMTVISLTTVGYGEIIKITGDVPAQIFTMILITFGMGVILYGISTLTALLIEGELTGIIRKEKMEKQIKKLKNHYIVCGGGMTGRHVIAELVKNKELVVLIEQDEANIEQCRAMVDLLYIKGDATDDENLTAASIDLAKGIIITLPNDKETLYITMTARMLNKNIRIISRIIDRRLEQKVIRAGADRVVSSNFIGALRMASEMIRPDAVDFLDSMLRSGQGNLRIHQLTVSENSAFADKNIIESGIKDKYNLLILGVRHKNKEIEFNPPPSLVLKEGMALIVMGEVDNIARAGKVF